VGDAERERNEDGKMKRSGEGERMKIAWRYERLGEFGSGIGGSRGRFPVPPFFMEAKTLNR
jgi:elongator complex protein 4